MSHLSPYKCAFEFLSYPVLLFLPTTPTYRDINFSPRQGGQENYSCQCFISMIKIHDRITQARKGIFFLYGSGIFSPQQPAFFFGSMKIHSIMGLGAWSRGYSPHDGQEVGGASIWYKFQRQPHSDKIIPPGPQQQYQLGIKQSKQDPGAGEHYIVKQQHGQMSTPPKVPD